MHNNRLAINNLKFFGFIFSMLLLLTPNPTVAQEKNGFGHDENYRAQDELNVDGHANTPSSNILKEKEVLRDSVITKPAPGLNPKTPDTTPQKKDEEETLSFNVLYFIIQKFKVSEMLN